MHSIAGLYRIHIVQQDTADVVAFEHLGEAELSLAETQKLIQPNIWQPGDKSDAIPDLLHPANLFGMRAERGAG
jgi:hypothetical protein